MNVARSRALAQPLFLRHQSAFVADTIHPMQIRHWRPVGLSLKSFSTTALLSPTVQDPCMPCPTSKRPESISDRYSGPSQGDEPPRRFRPCPCPMLLSQQRIHV